MSQTISPITGKPYGLERACLAWEASRSTFYSRKNRNSVKKKPDPKLKTSDTER
jgi:hypothetical protein